MPKYRLTLVFLGVDFWDDELMDCLAEQLPAVQWAVVDGEVRAEAVLDAGSAVAAAESLVAQVQAYIPAAQPSRVLEDLVAVSDIAQRVGVSRETVRLWSTGARGPGGFPRARAVVSRGTRIWDWASVSEWLRDNYSLVEEADSLNHQQVAQVSAALFAWDMPRSTYSIEPHPAAAFEPAPLQLANDAHALAA